MQKNNELSSRGDHNTNLQDVTAQNVTVNNNNNYQYHQNFDAQDLKLQEKITLDFYTRLDRKAQENDFRFFLSEKRFFEKPFLFFVHGFEGDRHEAIVKRLSEIAAMDFFGKPVISINCKYWIEAEENNKKKLISTLKSNILKSLENYTKNNILYDKFPRVLENCEFIQDIPLLKDSIVCFELSVFAKYWNNEILSILQENLLGEILNFNLNDKEQPIFFFFNLKYEPEKTGISALFGNKNKKIEKDIETFCKKNENNSYLFNKLSKINQKDVASFFNYEKFPNIIIDVNQFIGPNEELPFDVFYTRCKNEIARFYANDSKFYYHGK